LEKLISDGAKCKLNPHFQPLKEHYKAKAALSIDILYRPRKSKFLGWPNSLTPVVVKDFCSNTGRDHTSVDNLAEAIQRCPMAIWAEPYHSNSLGFVGLRFWVLALIAG
jgi:hypothetical protein